MCLMIGCRLGAGDARDGMIVTGQRLPILSATRTVDFRCGNQTLALMALTELKLDPHSGVIMIFRNVGSFENPVWDGTGNGDGAEKHNILRLSLSDAHADPSSTVTRVLCPALRSGWHLTGSLTEGIATLKYCVGCNARSSRKLLIARARKAKGGSTIAMPSTLSPSGAVQQYMHGTSPPYIGRYSKCSDKAFKSV